jgi:putative acetyltransferase
MTPLKPLSWFSDTCPKHKRAYTARPQNTGASRTSVAAAAEFPLRTIEISRAATTQQLDEVRTLLRAFLVWHRERHTEDIALIDRYFDAGEFEAELAGLPGKYAPPKGRLLLARKDDQAAGCVALRDLGENIAEMKRMFLPIRFRGQGIGRGLTRRLLLEARAAGYERIRLDTSFRQKEALALYESVGFKRIAPYYELPKEMRDWLVFMEMTL